MAVIGDVLGNRYRLIEDLGTGGMAWVYLAEDTRDGHSVAVKVLYPHFSQDMGYLNRFVREAKLASGLTSPHVVKVLDYGSTRDTHYLVMEYIRGQNLREILDARGSLPWRDALSIARQVCLALDHASQFGIVHRDIKPQNLMVTEDGTVKVLDFGIARSGILPSLTGSGFVGSPHYISPEQATSEPVDGRSDIYSLGVVLFEMLAGRVPFTADNPWSIIKQHLTDEPAAVPDENDGVPPAVWELVRVAMAKRKEDRFQSPLEFAQAIDQALAGGSPVPSPVGQAASVGYDTPLETPAIPDRPRERIEGSAAGQQADVSASALTIPPHAPASRLWWFASAAAVLIGLGLIAAGVILIGQQRERGIREEYDRAMQFYDQGDWEKALAGFDRVLVLAPNYEDVSFRKNEAVRLRELHRLYSDGKTQYQAGDTAKAITLFSQLQSEDATYGQPSVSEMLCDSYYRQAVGLSQQPQVKNIEAALELLNDGVRICPAHTAILSERKWLEGYREAVAAFIDNRWDAAVAKLGALEESDPTVADPRIVGLLYQVYLGLGQAREEQQEFSSALHFYRTAQSLPGVDHAQAAERQQVLEGRLASMTPTRVAAVSPTEASPQTPTPAALPTSGVTPGPQKPAPGAPVSPSGAPPSAALTSTAGLTSAVGLTSTAELTSALAVTSTSPSTSTRDLASALARLSTTGFKYPAPKPIGPPQESIFTAGPWEKITLQWEGPEKLPDDEYYDVSVLHFHNQQPVYWGTHTRENLLELPPGAGFGDADKDVFHWFVTIRRVERIDQDGKPDGPAISPKGEAWTLFWR